MGGAVSSLDCRNVMFMLPFLKARSETVPPWCIETNPLRKQRTIQFSIHSTFVQVL